MCLRQTSVLTQMLLTYPNYMPGKQACSNITLTSTGYHKLVLVKVDLTTPTSDALAGTVFSEDGNGIRTSGSDGKLKSSS